MTNKSFSFAISSIEKMSKLFDHEKYSVWNRTIKNCTKMIKLWKWIAVSTIAFATFIISIVEVTFVETFAEIFFENVVIDIADANVSFLFLFQQTKALKQFHEIHNLICTILKIICEKNVYSKIENMKNVANVWNHLKQMFKFRESDFFNDAFRQFENFILINCSNFANYVYKFWNLLNKFKAFFFKFIIFENYFIYRFHVNLNSKHNNYFERYA